VLTTSDKVEGKRQHTGDVALLHSLLGEPLGEDVGHALRRECDREGKFGVVSRHGSDVL